MRRAGLDRSKLYQRPRIQVDHISCPVWFQFLEAHVFASKIVDEPRASVSQVRIVGNHCARCVPLIPNEHEITRSWKAGYDIP